jgi:hypothetical protein
VCLLVCVCLFIGFRIIIIIVVDHAVGVGGASAKESRVAKTAHRRR